MVRLADELGLDLVGLQDHPYQRRFLDTFMLMPVLLAATEHISVFPDVANLPLRGAAMLAKSAASLDVMFPGRFRLGIGAGGFPEAVAAMGGPRLRPGEAVDAFEEAVHVIRMLWSGERGLRYEGRHHRLAGVHSGPVPVSDIEIWTGAGGPRMLEITGRLCDGWIPSFPRVKPEELASSHRIIDEAARAVGRDPAAVRRVYNLSGTIRPGPVGRMLDGPVDHWVEQLRELHEEHRMEIFVLSLDEDPEAQVRAFAEVAAALRG